MGTKSVTGCRVVETYLTILSFKMGKGEIYIPKISTWRPWYWICLISTSTVFPPYNIVLKLYKEGEILSNGGPNCANFGNTF